MDTPPRRKIMRLVDWDYSRPGSYAVTICTHDRVCLFGTIDNGEMILNAAGQIVAECWRQIPAHYPVVLLDEFVVMPNHLHGILFLDTEYGLKELAEDMACHVPTRVFGDIKPNTLSVIVGSFKAAATRAIRASQGDNITVWQTRFNEHIIRDLENHRHYIFHNPANWPTDEENLL